MEITRDAVEFTTPHESLVGAEGTSR
jgi:hypothetical protein